MYIVVGAIPGVMELYFQHDFTIELYSELLISSCGGTRH